MIRIRIHDHEKGMDTRIVDLPCIVNEFGQTEAISVIDIRTAKNLVGTLKSRSPKNSISRLD